MCEKSKEKVEVNREQWAQYGQVGQLHDELTPFMTHREVSLFNRATGFGWQQNESSREFFISKTTAEKQNKKAAFDKLTMQYAILDEIKHAGNVVTAEQISKDTYKMCKEKYGLSEKDVKKLVGDAQQGKIPEFEYSVSASMKDERSSISVRQHRNAETNTYHSSMRLEVAKNPFSTRVVIPRAEKGSLLKKILDESAKAKSKSKTNDKSIQREQGLEALRDELAQRRADQKLRSYEMVQLSDAEMSSYESRYGLSRKEVAKLSTEIQSGVAGYSKTAVVQQREVESVAATLSPTEVFAQAQEKERSNLESKLRHDMYYLKDGHSNKKRSLEKNHNDALGLLRDRLVLYKGEIPESVQNTHNEDLQKIDRQLERAKWEMGKFFNYNALKGSIFAGMTAEQINALQEYENAIRSHKEAVQTIERSSNMLAFTKGQLEKHTLELDKLKKNLASLGDDAPESTRSDIKREIDLLERDIANDNHIIAVEETKLSVAKKRKRKLPGAKKRWLAAAAENETLSGMNETSITALWDSFYGSAKDRLNGLCRAAKLVVDSEALKKKTMSDFKKLLADSKTEDPAEIQEIEKEIEELTKQFAEELTALEEKSANEIAELEKKQTAERDSLANKQAADKEAFEASQGKSE